MATMSTMGSRREYDLPPEPPKKPLCPFFLYRGDIYELVREDFPTLHVTEVTRIMAEMWKQVDEDLRQRYQAEYNINKQMDRK